MKTSPAIHHRRPIRRLASLPVLVALLLAMFAGRADAQQRIWQADFFANTSLSGTPVLSRTDSAIDFNWGGGAPAAGVPADGFSVRWSRTEWFDAGTYRFYSRSDDGFRLWVGDMQVFNNWFDQQGGWITRDLYLTAGVYPVRAEYYENVGGALVTLSWERISGGPGWQGEYYANRNLSGSPSLSRTDTNINFDWKVGSPASGLPTDNFSVRWRQTLGFSAGTYRFSASADDGVRIWVDGRAVVDAWFNQALPNTRTGDIILNNGLHEVKVEYYEATGQAAVRVWWDQIQPPPTPGMPSIAGWQAEYFNNRDLAGNPALFREDPAIDFDWGTGSPAPWIPSDNFSVRWTRQLTFDPGYYRFSVQSDDGVRVWLDGGLVIDKWQPLSGELHYVDGIYLSGQRQIRVDYFEQTGFARIKFWFSPSGTGSPTPPATPIPGSWQAYYFNNVDLSGNPALVRSEAAVDYNWGLGSPAAGVIGLDRFSARWTTTLNLAAGRYRFTVLADDGARLWINNQLVIDAWRVQAPTTYTYDALLPSGSTPVKIEYFENTERAVVRLTWTSAAPPLSPNPAPGTVLVDNGTAGFVKGGAASGWRAASAGHGGSLIWTKNNDYARAGYNWARWYPDLAPGRYEVFVYIPDQYASTTNARYWVRHADGVTLTRVDQSANHGRWVSLGSYRFAGDVNEYVSLSDITYEAFLSKQLAFDAVKWESR
jgi:hypothetical protein